MTVSDRIKQLRKGLKINQSDFAAMVGMSQSHISKIESGKDFASDKLLRIISAEFGVRYSWLKEGEEPVKSDADSLDESAIITSIRQFLSKCGKADKDLCLLTLSEMPKLFEHASATKDISILLEIYDLISNTTKLCETLNETTEKPATGKERELVDSAFWLKDHYGSKICGSVQHIINLYLGR